MGRGGRGGPLEIIFMRMYPWSKDDGAPLYFLKIFQKFATYRVNIKLYGQESDGQTSRQASESGSENLIEYKV